jgi:hypothetical protein
MNRNLSLALFAVLFAGLIGCSVRDGADPSPGALAEPPTAEGQEANLPPRLHETRAEFLQAIAHIEQHGLGERSIGQMMVDLGESYIGRPYIVGPLDGFGREVLVARLDSFDCFTYVEAMLAISRGVAEGDTTFEGYLRRTEEQRYRDGRAEGYGSRLHYFTEWIYRNEQRGIVRDVSEEVGGEPFPKQYGFMTANRESYPALVDDAIFEEIRRIETELNQEVRLHYIPQERLAANYASLQAGDIVAMATHIEGLDVTHTGFVYKGADGSTGLLHAGTARGVTIEPDLETYIQGINVQRGLIVARAIDPRQR